MEKTVFDLLIEIAGSQAELVRRYNSVVTSEDRKITPQAVSKWKNKVPSERVLDLEKALDGQITRYRIRPDVYGNAPSEEAA
jgi:DNA-binding transcriptional regulator YdaS (Cro superfamily)